MARNITKYINLRVLVLVACLVVFVLINSSQESYEGINDVPVSTLITTNVGSFNTTTETFPSSTGPTYPTDTPSPTSNGEIIQTEKPSVPSRVLPIGIGIAVIILIFLLYFRRRKEVSHSSTKTTQRQTTLKSRRHKFRTQIVTLVDLLEKFLRHGNFAEGIIFGYHQLDKNMKRVLGIKRETYLTPKEFSMSLNLPEILPHFRSIVDIFYEARYRISQMNYNDLERFILELKTIKDMSGKEVDIQITQTEELGEEE
ncbi:MAG: hypothetical protein HeimAB125_00190 [Candidatus Heimdallarchaeota archaeon AB_125]|nr:MAG: hypothetical protein HeimAB125_00190 [Candidatus Heimdallarchaeota archaeon AB_125]